MEGFVQNSTTLILIYLDYFPYSSFLSSTVKGLLVFLISHNIIGSHSITLVQVMYLDTFK